MKHARDDHDDLSDWQVPEPTPNQLRKEAAERGDVAYFLDIIRTQAWSLFSIGEMMRYMQRAAEVRAQADPEGYARELFARMVGFNSLLLLRTQIFVADRVVGRGPFSTTPALADLTPDTVDRLLPRLLEMQRSTAELLVAQAQATRLWGLARAKQAPTERPSPTGHPEDQPEPSKGEAGRTAAPEPKPGTAEVGARVVPLRSRKRRHG